MQKAAGQNPQAQYDLGGFYQFGRGVTERQGEGRGMDRQGGGGRRRLKPRSNMA